MVRDDVAIARQKRNSLAALLGKYVTARGENTTSPFMVFEGKEDASVWPVWFKRCGSTKKYEIFPCHGKEKVLQLRRRLAEKTAFNPGPRLYFVDRDFDDLADHPSGSDIFMTDRYAIENYFVDEDVVEYALNSQFGCGGDIKTRAKVLTLYRKMLFEFVEATAEINYRAFCAIKSGIKDRDSFPKKIHHIVDISKKWEISHHKSDPNDIIPFPAGLTGHDLANMRFEFNKLDPLTRYRGKFFYLFLDYFFREIQQERRSESSILFCSSLPPVKIKDNGLNMQSLAGFVDPPKDLQSFISNSNMI